MTAGVEARSDGRGWVAPLVALAVALAVAGAPLWPVAFAPAAALVGTLLPVGQTMLLVVPAVAACALLAWLGGGRGWVAAAWVALALWVATRPLPDGVEGYAVLARGWALLLAGAFGAVGVVAGTRSTFLPRALAAVALAAGIAGVATLRSGAPARVARVVRAESQRRADAVLDPWAARTAGGAWATAARRAPEAAARAADAAAVLRALPAAAVAVAPALVALESLGALALAWALYHRLARSRAGPALAPLAAFRFNDQLVWGLVAGATCVAVPTLAALRGLGLNLLVFFGALYALRGLAVCRWALGRRGVELPLGAGVALGFAFPLLGGVLAAVVTAAALALGLGDAWGGWRTRGRPA
ncbi:hypothetical protein tb265_00540 [Gemmatimonadetes bacterium T265]|nr:hypothetical protein tb265_00540 [Gemmatimonadetes bacterium T265]